MSVNIVVPEMGESIVDARIARWLKKEGDAVAVGEPLVELETDKVDVEVNAPQNGVLKQIAHAEGADVKIGDVLGTIAEGAATTPGRSSAARGRRTGPLTAAAPAAQPKSTNGRGVPATPSARKAAREQNVELSSVPAEGPRVTKADVDKRVRGREDRREAGSGQSRRARAEQGRGASAEAVDRPPIAAPSARVAHGRSDAQPEETRAHVEAPRDDRQAARRGAADRRDAHDVQRSRHERRDGAA